MTRTTTQPAAARALPGSASRSCRFVSRKYAAALAAAIAPFVMPGHALAACDQPSGVNNVTVNCTGTTSVLDHAFGNGTETGVTINLAPNAVLQSNAPNSVGIAIQQGTLNNGAGAVVSGGNIGIGDTLTTAILTVNNAGTISTSDGNANAAIIGDKVTVTNAATGLISSTGKFLGVQNGFGHGNGFGVAANTAIVDNSGTIFGLGSGVVGDTVDVTNRAGGQIIGGGIGVFEASAVSGGNVTVNNAGTLTGIGPNASAILADGALTLNNSGVISVTAGAGAVFVPGVAVDAGDAVEAANAIINNSGTISGRISGIDVISKLVLTNSGTIAGTAPGGGGVGADDLTVTNSGTILGTGPGSTAVVGVTRLELINQAGGLIVADHHGAGTLTTGVANITNSGTITVTGPGTAGNDLTSAIFGGDVTVNNTATGVISATGPSGLNGTAAIAVTTAHITNDGRIIGTNTVDSFGILLSSGTITNNRTGIISGASAIGEFGNGNGITIVNAGTIASNQGPNGVAIVLSQGGDTLTLKSSSRIIGKIDFGDLAHLGNDVLNIDNSLVTNTKVSSLTNRVSVDDVLANTLNFSGKVNVTGNNTVDAGGQPFVISGNQVAVLDPTALSQEDRTLLDFTGGVSSMVAGRLNGNSTQTSGMTAMSYAADDEASPALGYTTASRTGAPTTAMGDARALMLTKAPAANWNAAPITVWSSGFGGVRDQDAGNATLASRSVVAGAILGVDRRIRPDWLVGLFAGGGSGELSVAQNSQKVDTDYVFAGAYSRFEWGSQFLDLTLQGGNTRNNSTRTLLNNDAMETARASYNGWFVSPEVAYGYRLNIGNGYVLTPTARVRYLAGLLDGYTEIGSAETLSVGSRRLSNFEERGELELSHTTSLFGGDQVLKTTFHAGVIGLQRTGTSTVSAILIGQGLTFATPGGNTAGGVLGVALDYRVSRNASLFGAIEGTALADSSRSAAARGGLRVAF